MYISDSSNRSISEPASECPDEAISGRQTGVSIKSRFSGLLCKFQNLRLGASSCWFEAVTAGQIMRC